MNRPAESVPAAMAASAPANHAGALALCYAGMMSLAIAINLLPTFLTTLKGGLGGVLSDEQLGRVGAATFAGLVAGIVLTGPLADWLGAKPFTLLGHAMIALGLAILAAAPSYTAVLAACFAMGMGAGCLDMVLSPIVAALQPHKRAAAMNWLHSFYCVGAVVTVLISALAMRMGVSWRALALALAVLPVVVGAGFVGFRHPPMVHQDQQRTPLRLLCRQRYFLAALAAIFLGGATELGLQQWLPSYAQRSLGYSQFTANMALLGFSVAMAVGRMAVGVVGHRISPVRIMIVCCAASVVLFLLASFAPWPGLALGACVAVGLTGSTLWPSMLGVAADRYPHGGASMFALLAALGNLGGIFMPWIVGLTADYSSMAWGLSTATLCPLFMGLILLGMGKPVSPKAGSRI